VEDDPGYGLESAHLAMLEKLVAHTLPFVPQPIMRRLASRYIAGESLPEALDRLTALAQRGFPGILDLLGEHIQDEAAARKVAASYQEAATALEARGLDAYVSIKPTHVGLMISEDLTYELYAGIARQCAAQGRLVRVEMEDAPTVDATLRVFARLRESFDNVGIVLQSRLFRTPADIEHLTRATLPTLDVRMVKGIYLEPTAIAHVDPEPIREAFVAGCRALLGAGARVAFGTHDGGMGERLVQLVGELDVPTERYEFQVLLGVQEPLWERWKEGGHPVRAYVPYGPDWRAYSTRRLMHNPQILRSVLRNTLGLGSR